MKLIKTLLLVLFLALPLTAEDRAYVIETEIPTLFGMSQGFGTGFFMDGKLYTCTHVSVGENDTFLLHGDEKTKLTILGTYLQYDVSMFEAPKGLKKLESGKEMKIGECEIVGAKIDLDDNGEIQKEVVKLEGKILSRARSQFEVWACVYAGGVKGGFSGSPVLQDGKVVGMVVAQLTHGPHRIPIALVVPVKYLLEPFDAKREKEFIEGLEAVREAYMKEVEKIHEEADKEHE